MGLEEEFLKVGEIHVYRCMSSSFMVTGGKACSQAHAGG